MKFAADAMLGKLARWLRILGYDVSYQSDVEDDELMRTAKADGRLILTRDTRLVARLGDLPHLFIRDNAPADQLRQTVSELKLAVSGERFLSRCSLCNTPLAAADREDVRGLVPEYTYGREAEFYRCPSCGRVYWPGTHRRKMFERLKALTGLGDEGN